MIETINKNPLLQNPHLTCEDNKEFQTFLQAARYAPILAIDTENSGDNHTHDIRDGRGYTTGISTAINLEGLGRFSYYFPFRHEMGNLSNSYLFELKRLIENHPRIIAHNIKHDFPALTNLGITPPKKGFWDTILLAHRVNENLFSYALDSLARTQLKIKGKEKSPEFKKVHKLFGWGSIPASLMAPYAAQDASLCLDLAEHYGPQMAAEDQSGALWAIEEEFLWLLIGMEARGIRVDIDLAEKEIIRGNQVMSEILKELNNRNPSSRNDLEALLIDELGLPVVKETPTGQPSFDKFTMQEYELILEHQNNPLAHMILEYRGYQKTVSSNWQAYLTLLSPDGRLRPSYKVHGTRTGRTSCEKPNLQQIPKVDNTKEWNYQVKSGFIPAEGFGLWGFDYAQLEQRLAAAYGKEEKLLEIFRDDSRDLFTEMASQLGMSRGKTKTLNYTILFGGGYNRIKNVFGVSYEKAKEIKDNYFDTYPGLKTVERMAKNKCKNTGQIKLWSGRVRHFADSHADSHKAFNSVIQGGAAEIVKRKMIELDKADLNNDSCRMLLNTHDELAFEIEEGMEDIYGPEIKNIMEKVEPDFGVPFKVDFHRWSK